MIKWVVGWVLVATNLTGLFAFHIFFSFFRQPFYFIYFYFSISSCMSKYKMPDDFVFDLITRVGINTRHDLKKEEKKKKNEYKIAEQQRQRLCKRWRLPSSPQPITGQHFHEQRPPSAGSSSTSSWWW